MTQHDDAPDWAADEEDLLCPRCGYNLRMLTEPRCPECGLRSTWRELTERTAHEDRTGLFEYWCGRRPARSLASTLWRCMFPWLLWPRIPIVARPRVRPLLGLVLITALLTIAFYLVNLAVWSFVLPPLWGLRSWRGGWVVAPRVMWDGAREGLLVAGLMLLALLLVLLGMLVFRQSMKRFHVVAAHVVRIAVLSWCGFAFWTEFVAHAVTWVAAVRWTIPPPLELAIEARDVLPLGCLVLSISLAWSAHLKVTRGWAVGPLVVLMVTVAMSVFAFLYTFELAGSLNNVLLDLVADRWPGATLLCEYVFEPLML